jgi:molecular chaperone GrpE
MNQDKQTPEGNPEAVDGDPQEHVETAILPDEVLERIAAGNDGANPDAAADELAAARAEAEQNWNKLLRLTAEMDNLRKRHARELEKARNFGVEGLAGELLAVADSLEMGLEVADKATVEALVDGQRGTLKQLRAALDKYGVQRLEPEGEPFDPELHEAMTLQPSTTAEPNTVLTVVQTGYTLNGRLLRPARVVVAKAPDPAG